MTLIVEEPGLWTTVQDLGRFGAREWGVPVGGAFDVDSFMLANALLDNPPDSAAIESTLLGGTFRALDDSALAIAGALFEAWIVRSDGRPQTLSIPQSFTLKEGERLILGKAIQGARSYLAVQGGWRAPIVLGSRSIEKPLLSGDILPSERPSRTPESRIELPWRILQGNRPIRIIDGPDVERLTDRIAAWEGRLFQVGSNSDRMGVRLEGKTPDFESEPIRISAPVAPGAVQGTASGLIILGVACGTTGGYPHLAHLISADLDRLAQARPRDRISFRRIAVVEARRLDRAEREKRRRRFERVAEICRLSRRSSSVPSRS